MREWLEFVTEHVILIINWMALFIVIYAAVEAFVQAIRLVLLKQEGLDARIMWLRFARLLVAALTFQLAADIIETSVSSDWESLGRIAVVAVVRTFLNYFLEKDVQELDRGGRKAAKV
jgi:uncharacterized membrane protein